MSFDSLITKIRSESKNTVELGNSFEQICKIFLENDDLHSQEYEKIWHYKEWAKEYPNFSPNDIGTDLVASIKGSEGKFCAIQCKCFGADHSVTKEDIDTFMSSSESDIFEKRLLMDTSTQDLGRHARSAIENSSKEFIRIQSSEFRDSRIDWLSYLSDNEVRLRSKKELRDYQVKDVKAVVEGLEEDDRGKLIMACGTGKTFVSLRIAEKIAGKGKMVLYMVPSLALMSQTIREWKNDAAEDFYAFSACSDKKVGKRKQNDDEITIGLNDLSLPATTNPSELAEKIKNQKTDKMIVVFSTYQSIDVISSAQYEHNLEEFDLIICDEAHRTTGATLKGDDESNFVKIHDNENIQSKKRLYMTATPRIFGENAKSKAQDAEVELASMDDEKKYGKVLANRGFGWAVENNILSDYKVVVLAVDEGIVSQNVQETLQHQGNELSLDDATKIIGCYKALQKIGFDESKKTNLIDGTEDNGALQKPMKRAIAFTQTIAVSELFSEEFSNVVNEYNKNESIDDEFKSNFEVKTNHVDGTYNAEERSDLLNWLKEEDEENICHILSNARCLSEGVDVPSLDAILFLHPKKSQVDVIQAVGRVMRKAEGKDLGYIILPITIAPGVPPEIALNNNEKYKVIWQLLNALRAHDERFDSAINKLGLGEDVSDRIDIVGIGGRDEVDATTAVIEDINTNEKKSDTDDGKDEDEDKTLIGAETEESKEESSINPEQLSFIYSDLSKAIKAKIVDKCGTRDYWENWASDIAKIADQHIKRIKAIVFDSKAPEREIFQEFLEEIRDDLNPEITETEAVEMLSQHIITKPVFDNLFQGNNFTEDNAVSKAMEKILARIYDKNIESEQTNTLKRFYKSVERRSSDIVTSKGRQTLILELYDKFFKYAFPKMTEKLGIVYTPIEVVDFIIQSIEDILKEEFDLSLENENVNILDPFTGTGTFITRLLQSGIISKKGIKRKFNSEIHANELVLLAYYISSINIESAYADIVRENQYKPFEGIVLTDSFQLYEQERDMIADLLPDNSQRRTKQKKHNINVIIGNPPYSVGQRTANDNAENMIYPQLHQRIKETYIDSSKSGNRYLYDSYIKSFRWATDRLKGDGIIGFVTNGGWLDANSTDGMRKTFEKEFSKIYVFHLRGNQRTRGEESKKEGGKIFDKGSRAPIAITFLVKNSKVKKNADIYFYDIGDYLSRRDKLKIINNFVSINTLIKSDKFKKIKPDEENDWINQGDKNFKKYIAIGDKKNKLSDSIFRDYSSGVKSNRDAWAFNFSRKKLSGNMKLLIGNYNNEIDRHMNDSGLQINKNPKEINWDSRLLNDFEKKKYGEFSSKKIHTCIYRPFTRSNIYLCRQFNNSVYKVPQIFFEENNPAIGITGVGSDQFSCLITDKIPCYDYLSKSQCFPMFMKQGSNKDDFEDDLFSGKKVKQTYTIDNISDEALNHLREKYGDHAIGKKEMFFYIYGLLHSSDYRERFKNNLTKELPRILFPRKLDSFKDFEHYGKKLSDLHLNFEKQIIFPVTIKEGDLNLTNIENPKEFYRVEKMKFKKKGDKSVVIYNKNITIENIPLEAYDYFVGGQSALNWVMERQTVKTDSSSGIINDANDYANEVINNPAYPLELFQRVITVSLETMKIVKSLPKLDID